MRALSAGVVIDKDKPIQTDIQPPRNSPQIFGLVVPVRDEGRNVRSPQEHIGVLIKYRLGNGRIILRTDRQNNAALLQLLGMSLQGQVRFS